MKIVVTGAAGLFGRGMMQAFGRDHQVTGLTRADADITDEAKMRKVLAAERPELIVHPAGIPDIDLCERDPELAYRVNTEATRGIAATAEELGAALAYISTDAVFDGTKNVPYVETDATNPISVYGRSKVHAEDIVRKLARHWIFRVSVLFGPGKTNFVEKGLRKLAMGEAYPVAVDQVGSATCTLDAAETMLRVFAAEAYGTFHLCNAGQCSRYELAVKAAELAKLDSSKVIARPMEQMTRPGPRLKYSVMAMKALCDAGIAEPRAWEKALAEYIENLEREGVHV